jgi:hypothetical protein
MQAVVINRSVLPTEFFLSILLACLCRICGKLRRVEAYFCRLANFLTDNLPLVGVVLLDCGKQRSALLSHQFCLHAKKPTDTHFILGELCIVHILLRRPLVISLQMDQISAYLVPMFFHTSFSPLRKSLRSTPSQRTQCYKSMALATQSAPSLVNKLPLQFHSSCYPYLAFVSA